MSISYCNDCETIVEGQTTINYLTPDPNAYEDGEYVVVCDMCGGDDVVELREDP